MQILNAFLFYASFLDIYKNKLLTSRFSIRNFAQNINYFVSIKCLINDSNSIIVLLFSAKNGVPSGIRTHDL